MRISGNSSTVNSDQEQTHHRDGARRKEIRRGVTWPLLSLQPFVDDCEQEERNEQCPSRAQAARRSQQRGDSQVSPGNITCGRMKRHDVIERETTGSEGMRGRQLQKNRDGGKYRKV